MLATKTINVVTPLIGKGRARQLWATAFMATGLLVCTPALPELHEQVPVKLGKAVNQNMPFRLIVSA